MKKFSIVVLFSVWSSLAFGANAPKAGKGPQEPTKEQRQKMAEMHEKMASCLKSDKPMGECHDEMKKMCKDMPKGSCPMGMHGGHMGKGHHGGHEDHDDHDED